MKVRNLRPGLVVRISLPDGREFKSEIAEVKGGKVITGVPGLKRPNRWWLPVAYAKYMTVVDDSGVVLSPRVARPETWSPHVKEIVKLLKAGGIWQKDIAARFGITPSAVSQISRRAEKAGLLR
jgi:hypothetical protein